MIDLPYISDAELENEARELFQSTNTKSIPIDVDLVAHRLGIKVEYTDLGDDISGVLVLSDNKQPYIGINDTHSMVRQRFSLAHEIAHFILHSSNSELFIDKNFKVAFRGNFSSSPNDRMEIQANILAAAILMPDDLIINELNNSGFDLCDENLVSDLAETFQVSSQAMAIRLSKLEEQILEE